MTHLDLHSLLPEFIYFCSQTCSCFPVCVSNATPVSTPRMYSRAIVMCGLYSKPAAAQRLSGLPREGLPSQLGTICLIWSSLHHRQLLFCHVLPWKGTITQSEPLTGPLKTIKPEMTVVVFPHVHSSFPLVTQSEGLILTHPPLLFFLERGQ